MDVGTFRIMVQALELGADGCCLDFSLLAESVRCSRNVGDRVNNSAFTVGTITSTPEVRPSRSSRTLRTGFNVFKFVFPPPIAIKGMEPRRSIWRASQGSPLPGLANKATGRKDFLLRRMELAFAAKDFRNWSTRNQLDWRNPEPQGSTTAALKDVLTTKKLVCLFSSANSGHAQASVCNIVATVHPEAAGALRQECMALERREKPAKHATKDSGKSKRTSGKKSSDAKSSFYEDYIVSVGIVWQLKDLLTYSNTQKAVLGCKSLESAFHALKIVEIQRGGRVAEVDDKLA
ncbi:ARM repeat superfamily protein [Artemisia annua]|uniref:ARM repeat superfamily protein n=1 Tax=Artemisia annua TaxID=35608 RepID=A0A2U1NR50_ARTAN|nr:ARM repeat superfamily protein [Artemisia annua]